MAKSVLLSPVAEYRWIVSMRHVCRAFIERTPNNRWQNSNEVRRIDVCQRTRAIGSGASSTPGLDTLTFNVPPLQLGWERIGETWGTSVYVSCDTYIKHVLAINLRASSRETRSPSADIFREAHCGRRSLMSYCCPTTRFLFHKRFLCLTTRHLLPPFHSPKLRLPSDGPGQTVPSAGGSW